MKTTDYPNAPGFKTGDTSREAAASVGTMLATLLRGQCLTVLQSHPAGLTADEVADKMDLSILSIRPRISELKRKGSIVDSGKRRQNFSGRNARVMRCL